MKSNCLILLAVTAFALISCSSVNTSSDGATDNDTNTESGLLGRAWGLRSFTALSGDLTPVSETTKYQFLFDSQSKKIEAFIGCVNYFDSAYELNDGYLTMKLGSRDGVQCNTDTEEFSAQNSAIMSLLQGGNAGESIQLIHSIANTTLTLSSSDGRTLFFVEVDEVMQQGATNFFQLLENTRWEFNSFLDREGNIHVIPRDAEWGMRFQRDENLSQDEMIIDFGPCFPAHIAYSIENAELSKLGGVTVPDPLCTGAALIQLPELEILLWNMVNDSMSFTLVQGNEGTLTITAMTGEVLNISK